MYIHGDGVKVDPLTGLRWLRAAAALDEPQSENLLGTLYEYGRARYPDYGVNDDWDTTAKLWQASAAWGLRRSECA